MKPAPAILACLFLLTAGCGDDTGDAPMRTAPVDVREELRSRRTDPQIVVEGNTAFALDLYAKLSQQPGNLFVSPCSISLALGMTYAGARGETEQQMARVLHFELSQNRLHPALGALATALTPTGTGGPRLAIANRLWGREGYRFRDTFLAITRDQYGAELARTVFPEPGRTEINAWTADQTVGKIEELLKEGIVDGSTVLVLVSAIYFKGQWVTPFPEDQTKPANFHVTPTDVIKVPMMHTDHAFFPYGETEDVQILELPYRAAGRDGECSMVILLPKAKDGLAKLEASLTTERLRQLLLLPAGRGKFPVYLPKFSFSSQIALLDTLREMGLTNVHDFRGMTEGGSPFLSAVEHASFIAVDEQGTEAAAATAVVISDSPAGQWPIFRADHPFLFLIRHRATGSILFLGRLAKP
jgi:serpin B